MPFCGAGVVVRGGLVRWLSVGVGCLCSGGSVLMDWESFCFGVLVMLLPLSVLAAVVAREKAALSNVAVRHAQAVLDSVRYKAERAAMQKLLWRSELVLLQAGRPCGRVNIGAVVEALPSEIRKEGGAGERVLFEMPKVGYSVALGVNREGAGHG